MDEARLSPDLGRLIDRAKGAAVTLEVKNPAVETVALLTEDGCIYTGAVLERSGQAARDSGEPFRSAASLALDAVEDAGAGEVLAAVVAAPYDPADTVAPSVATYERLVGLDPELPLILKQHGRWVMLPASSVTPSS